MTDAFFLAAVDEALLGLSEGGVPIGSVLVVDGVIVGRGHNQRVQQGSVVLHAEMAALEDAGRLSVADYRRSTLYTTLSPCAMCTGAALLYGIPRVVVEVLDDAGCIEMMTTFIAANPDLWNEDIGE